MDYIKAQQDILAEILTPNTRGVPYFHDKVKEQTAIFDPLGHYGYEMPTKLIALDLGKCCKLDKFPFKICPASPEYEITTDGTTVTAPVGKGVRVVHKNAKGDLIYTDKRLLAKFGKKIRLYQEQPLGVITIVNELNNVIGYLCPCRAPKNNPINQ